MVVARVRTSGFGIAALTLLPAVATAQILPTEPIQLADGRLVLGGQIALTVSSDRDTGYFNYTDYDHNALRLFRLAMSGSLEATEHISILGELQTENCVFACEPGASDFTIRPYALYMRVRPWPSRPVDIQLGRIPPVFGGYARRAYAVNDPLIGYPLAYQYLTSLRPDALPASADDVLRMRGRGWAVRYPLGATGVAGGLPLMTAFRWDTGAQVRIGRRPLELSIGLTTGTLANPRVDDDNDGKQVATHLRWQPSAGFIVGLSAARGSYVADAARAALPAPAREGRFTQRALGLDLEYARGYWLVRAEGLWSAWRVPTVQAPLIDDPLGAVGLSLEGQYKIAPGLVAAGRVDHLTFSRISGTLFDGRPTRWDAPVSRWEFGGRYYLRRNLIGKVAYQYNWRDGGRVTSKGLLAGQMVYWF